MALTTSSAISVSSDGTVPALKDMAKASNPTPSHDDLTRRVQSLPQELIDMIFSHMFQNGDWYPLPRIRHGRYTPPWELQVNRAVRQWFAPQFYGKRERFSFIGEDEQTFEVYKKWSRLLPEEHRRLIRWVNFTINIKTKQLIDNTAEWLLPHDMYRRKLVLDRYERYMAVILRLSWIEIDTLDVDRWR